MRMVRRASIKLFLFATLIFAQELPKVKNIVVILSDDHALNVTGAYGNEIIRTPNIDRLSKSGIRFNNAYCNAPICSASRQSLLTGKYPHATGVNLLFTPFQNEGNVTIAEHLKKYDYRSALIGKSHFNNWIMSGIYKNGLPKHGFDTLIQNGEYVKFLQSIQRKPLPQGMRFYNSKEINRDNVAEWMNYLVLPQPVYDNESRGTFYAQEAIKFIEENKKYPFLLWLAFNEPHHPYYFPVEYSGSYNPEQLILPEGSPEDDRWIPERFKYLTDEEKKGIIASYYTSTEYMDKNIGLVVDALEEMNISEETLIIYISDNGYLLNDHKRFEKHTMWEEAVNQPMIFKFGNNYRGGTSSEAIVEYVDIVPTIIELLGIDLMKEVQGRSFLSVLEGEQKFKDHAFSEYLEDNLAMVANIEWKYMFTTGRRDLGIGYKTGNGPSGIVHRLYNLNEDPGEKINLSKDTKYSDILFEMKNIMLQHFLNTHPDAENCPDDLTLDGKLVWFCEPRDIGTEQSFEDIPFRVFYNNN